MSAAGAKYWELRPSSATKVVKDDVLFQRGWCWPTEGDAAAVLEISKFMVEGKLIPKPLTWAQVKRLSARRLPLVARPTSKRQHARRSGVHGEGREGPARPAGVGDEQLEGARVTGAATIFPANHRMQRERKERMIRRIHRTGHDGRPDGAERAQRGIDSSSSTSSRRPSRS